MEEHAPHCEGDEVLSLQPWSDIVAGNVSGEELCGEGFEYGTAPCDIVYILYKLEDTVYKQCYIRKSLIDAMQVEPKYAYNREREFGLDTSYFFYKLPNPQFTLDHKALLALKDQDCRTFILHALERPVVVMPAQVISSVLPAIPIYTLEPVRELLEPEDVDKNDPLFEPLGTPLRVDQHVQREADQFIRRARGQQQQLWEEENANALENELNEVNEDFEDDMDMFEDNEQDLFDRRQHQRWMQISNVIRSLRLQFCDVIDVDDIDDINGLKMVEIQFKYKPGLLGYYQITNNEVPDLWTLRVNDEHAIYVRARDICTLLDNLYMSKLRERPVDLAEVEYVKTVTVIDGERVEKEYGFFDQRVIVERRPISILRRLSIVFAQNKAKNEGITRVLIRIKTDNPFQFVLYEWNYRRGLFGGDWYDVDSNKVTESVIATSLRVLARTENEEIEHVIIEHRGVHHLELGFYHSEYYNDDRIVPIQLVFSY